MLSRRIDASAWLARLGTTPADVAQHLELAELAGVDDVAEALLRGVDDRMQPTWVRSTDASLARWKLPMRRAPRPPRRTWDASMAAHFAAVLGLAARGNGDEARRVRAMKRLHVPAFEAWWTPEGFARFENLEELVASVRWHVDAPVPSDLLCLPRARVVGLGGARLGDAVLQRLHWNLPAVTSLSLSGNDLTTVPEAVRGLRTLESLLLVDNPIRALPAWLGELPRLREVDVRGTRVSAGMAGMAGPVGVRYQSEGAGR